MGDVLASFSRSLRVVSCAVLGSAWRGFLLLLEGKSSVLKAGDALVCGHSLLPLCSNSWLRDSLLLSGGDADEAFLGLFSNSFSGSLPEHLF